MDHLSSLLAFGQWLVIMIANKAKDFACMSKKKSVTSRRLAEPVLSSDENVQIWQAMLNGLFIRCSEIYNVHVNMYMYDTILYYKYELLLVCSHNC